MNKWIVAIFGFITCLAIWMAVITRNSLKEIEKEIGATADSLKKVNSIIREVNTSLGNTTLRLDSMIVELDKSKSELNLLYLRSSTLNLTERKKVSSALENLQLTREALEEEKARAGILIQQLSSSKNHE